MSITKQMRSARALLGEVRASQRVLLNRTEGKRTLSYDEGVEFDNLELAAKKAELELATLEEQLAAQALTARAPRSEFD